VDWQQIVVAVVVLVTVALFVRHFLRLRNAPPGVGHDCGCSRGSGPAEKSSIIVRGKKGERPEVVVRMK
jgi:hypothetical protein